MTAVRRRDALAEVGAPGAIGAPERVLAVREVNARLADRGVEAVQLQRAEEGHLDVEVILTERVVDHRWLPDRHLVGWDDLVLPFELGGCAPRHAGNLSDPAAFYLVAVLLHRQPAKRAGIGGGSGGAKGHGQQQDHRRAAPCQTGKAVRGVSGRGTRI
jgi:hypothetical protein